MIKLKKNLYKVNSEKRLLSLVAEVKGFNEQNKYENIKLVDEKILAIYLNSQEVLTAMTICDYPEYLAAGFLHNQNILKKLDEIESIDYDEELSAVVVRTKEETLFEQKNIKRIKTSGCALGTIFGDMFNKLTPIPKTNKTQFKLSHIRQLVKEINMTPSLYLEAGAIHGSVLCSSSKPLVYMEDVGRHNAVDKVSGWMLIEKIDPEDKILYTTGRLTSEMVLKAVSMKIPVLVSRSGFTRLAVDLAKQFNLTMIGRFKGKRFSCVSRKTRILFDK
jgi:FdhD protein